MPNPLHTKNYLIFRELLIKARLSSGITQAQIAQKLGKPQSYISKYERGERRLDFPEFIEIATILAIDLDTFIADYKKSLKIPLVKKTNDDKQHKAV